MKIETFKFGRFWYSYSPYSRGVHGPYRSHYIAEMNSIQLEWINRWNTNDRLWFW